MKAYPDFNSKLAVGLYCALSNNK